jgi:hypothetical protein
MLSAPVARADLVADHASDGCAADYAGRVAASKHTADERAGARADCGVLFTLSHSAAGTQGEKRRECGSADCELRKRFHIWPSLLKLD